jgi:hypothetical protein
MTIEVIKYRKWRQELHDKQIEIDALDEKFWSSDRITSDDSWNDLHTAYENDRSKLVQALNDHYENEPEIPVRSNPIQ